MAGKTRKDDVTADQEKYAFPPIPTFDSALIARTGEILSDAATQIWTREIELLRLETELAARSLLPLHADGADKLPVEQWQDSAGKIINQMREVGDAVRDCGWRLFDLYSQNALKTVSSRHVRHPE